VLLDFQQYKGHKSLLKQDTNKINFAFLIKLTTVAKNLRWGNWGCKLMQSLFKNLLSKIWLISRNELFITKFVDTKIKVKGMNFLNQEQHK
jgi:hypothetical protein